MISYNNSDIIQCLRQYDMFANSLKLVYSEDEKKKIINQLNKLLVKGLKLTNDIYEEEYNALVNKETLLLDEEKTRLTLLIELINQRISYVERQCQNHYQITGERIDYPLVMGYDTLDGLESKIKIIDKYIKNEKTKKELEKEISELENKIDLAKEKIQINESLNVELEKKLIEFLDKIFSDEYYRELLNNKEQIVADFDEVSYLYDKAEENVNIARDKSSEYLIDCQSLAIDMKHKYREIDNTLNIVNLMDFYTKESNDYNDLLIKREKINDILGHITDEELLIKIKPEIDKQYVTIKKEEQDEKTYNELVNEIDKDKDIIDGILKEEESDEFQNALGKILENEKKKQQLIMEEEKRKKEEEKQKQQEIERRRQEEISKRQRIIEENRKKEIEKRTKQMLEEQNNSFLNPKKEGLNFAKLKDDMDKNASLVNLDSSNTMSSIEKELFEEFEKNKKEDNEAKDDKILSRIEKNETINNVMEDSYSKNNEFPEGNLDDYMKSFDENNVKDIDLDSILGDDFFPNIPD